MGHHLVYISVIWISPKEKCGTSCQDWCDPFSLPRDSELPVGDTWRRADVCGEIPVSGGWDICYAAIPYLMLVKQIDPSSPTKSPVLYGLMVGIPTINLLMGGWWCCFTSISFIYNSRLVEYTIPGRQVWRAKTTPSDSKCRKYPMWFTYPTCF